MAKAKSTFILIRHAHRDVENRSSDNGLSEKGLKQAKLFQEYFKENFHLQNALLLSSPKKRCVQTLKPVSRLIEKKIRIENELDEQGHQEESCDFSYRAESFVTKIRKSESPLIVACTHGDVIPLILELLKFNKRDLSKGEWVKIEL